MFSNTDVMKSNGEYDWSFSSVGGTTRVNLSTGEDILHLDELDQKLWTVLSCPVSGLETDPRILSILDSDADGHIHVQDIIRTVKWLKPILNDPDTLLRGDSYMPLANFNRNTPEGEALFCSARHILQILGLDQEFISTDNVSDTTTIYKNTPFNGDGIITALTPGDKDLQDVIKDAVSTVGSIKDRSGEDGINAELIDKFFAALNDYVAWKEAGEADRDHVFPYGDETGTAYDAFLTVRDKIDDWYIRCSLASFDSGSLASLDTSSGRIGAISDRNLYECSNEIAACPLAKVNPEGELPTQKGINPAWTASFSAFRKAVLDKESLAGDVLTESRWKAIKEKFVPFAAWLAAKKGSEVEALGYERIRKILDMNAKETLNSFVAKDLEFAPESENISQVTNLLFIYRDFFRFLNNFITFKDFYTPDETCPAVFQAGKLYIDQRCCSLCIKVADMGKQASMAPLSQMFLLYCDCVSKHTNDTLTIVAAVTDGSIDNLREGKNGIFYDRHGLDYDATVIKIIDNPISIRQAFWTPYRRLANFVSESLNKFASDKESKVISKGMSDITDASGAVTSGTAAAANPAPAKQPFDVAKFAGLFAMIGMALGTILGFVLDLFKGFAQLSALQMVLVILGLILVISGPSMLKAWIMLRKRNITPLLNANGWAINSKLLINVPFGVTLTTVAKFPIVMSPEELKKRHRVPWYVTLISILIIILGIAIAVTLWHNPKNGHSVSDTPAEPAAVEQVEAGE